MKRDLTDVERAFLTSDQRQLARVATVGEDGLPHVVPTGWTYNEQLGTIDVTGRDVQNTKKYRDVTATGLAALVVDGIADGTGWQPWALEIRGAASAVPGPPAIIRIQIEHVASWGLEAAIS